MAYLPQCPACQSNEHIVLGALGRTKHFRCRCCSMQYSHTPRARKPRKAPDPLAGKTDKQITDQFRDEHHLPACYGALEFLAGVNDRVAFWESFYHSADIEKAVSTALYTRAAERIRKGEISAEEIERIRNHPYDYGRKS